MNSTAKKISTDELSILQLTVGDNTLSAHISDGRAISIPILWFTRLQNASREELEDFEISPSGYGIHWPKPDEDISIKAFINPNFCENSKKLEKK